MKTTLRLCTIVLIGALLTACASRQPKYDAQVLTLIPNQTLQGKTFGVFPLDETKLSKLETRMFVGEVAKGLTPTGMVVGGQDGSLPDYIVLYDYATEIGIDAPFEHVFLMIAYDVSGGSRNQIYKARLKVNSTDNNPVVALSPAIASLTKVFPNQIN